jgi:hypothetical protein
MMIWKLVELQDNLISQEIPQDLYRVRVSPPPFLDEFLEVDPSIIDGSTFAVEGSAIKTSLVVNSGDVLSFNSNFLTNETSPLIDPMIGPLDDAGFYLVNGSLTTLGSPSNATLPSSSFNSETGLTNTQITFPTAGNYDVAFGVIDREDYVITSGLSVSDVILTSDSTSIPEAGTVKALLSFTSLLLVSRAAKQLKNFGSK